MMTYRNNLRKVLSGIDEIAVEHGGKTTVLAFQEAPHYRLPSVKAVSWHVSIDSSNVTAREADGSAQIKQTCRVRLWFGYDTNPAIDLIAEAAVRQVVQALIDDECPGYFDSGFKRLSPQKPILIPNAESKYSEFAVAEALIREG